MRKLSLIPFMIWLAPSVAAADERSNPDAEWAAEILNVVPEGKPKAPNLALTLKPFQLDTLVFDFPSGLRIMFQQDNTSPVVAVTTLLDVGASDDPETEAGMAHVLEHSWFLSSQEGASSVWTLQKSDMGCSLNASTGYDATTYMSVCPSTEIERLLRLNSALIMDPINGVTEEQLATELEVVRNEIRMRTENGNIPGFSIMGSWQNIRLATVTPTLNPWQGTTPPFETSNSTRSKRGSKSTTNPKKPPSWSSVISIHPTHGICYRCCTRIWIRRCSIQHSQRNYWPMPHARASKSLNKTIQTTGGWWPWTPTNLSRC